MPTFAEIAGQETPEQIDGISLIPTLKGDSGQRQHDYLYWEFVEQGGKQAIRKGDWKAVRLNLKQDRYFPIEIYNLKNDPSESNNIAGQHPEIVVKMDTIFRQARVPNPVFSLFE
jgi:arylsulfatase A-like enzyme